MAEMFSTFLFYVFALMTVLSALAVISSKNPVHSVFFLILAFFNTAGLFLLIGAEYLAMTLVIVYVGAVAVLFLFVVMMLDVNITEMRKGFAKNLPLGLGVAGILFAEIILVIYRTLNMPNTGEATLGIAQFGDMTNTRAIGNVLYTDYIYAFQLAGLVLLVAMIGAIMLTHRTRPGVRKQRVASQIARKREDAMEIVSVEPGQGA